MILRVLISVQIDSKYKAIQIVIFFFRENFGALTSVLASPAMLTVIGGTGRLMFPSVNPVEAELRLSPGSGPGICQAMVCPVWERTVGWFTVTKLSVPGSSPS